METIMYLLTTNHNSQQTGTNLSLLQAEAAGEQMSNKKSDSEYIVQVI